MENSNLFQNLITKGYCVIKNAIGPNEIEFASKISNKIISNYPNDLRNEQKSLGSIIPIENYPELSNFWSKEINSFKNKVNLGFNFDICKGVIFSKKYKTGPTFWHQDALYWDLEEAYSEKVIQINILVYLNSTQKESGCLKVIPYSHRRLNKIHKNWQNLTTNCDDKLDIAIKSARENQNREDWLYSDTEDTEFVEVKAGDIVILDSRILHGACENEHYEERILHSFFAFIDNKEILERSEAVLDNKNFSIGIRMPDLGRLL